MPGAVSAFLWTPALGVAASVWAAEMLRTDLTTTGDTCPLTPGYGYGTPGYRVVIVASAPGFPSHGRHRHKGCEAVLALPHSQEAAGVVPVSRGAVWTWMLCHHYMQSHSGWLHLCACPCPGALEELVEISFRMQKHYTAGVQC